MGFAIRIDTQQLARDIGARLQLAEARARELTLKALVESSRGILLRNVKLLAPKATGSLQASHEVAIDEQNLRATLFSRLQYSIYVNLGRRARKRQPPPGALIEWLRLKGIPDELEFVIARAIGKRGIPEDPYLEDAFEQSREPIVDHFRRTLGEGI